MPCGLIFEGPVCKNVFHGHLVHEIQAVFLHALCDISGHRQIRYLPKHLRYPAWDVLLIKNDRQLELIFAIGCLHFSHQEFHELALFSEKLQILCPEDFHGL